VICNLRMLQKGPDGQVVASNFLVSLPRLLPAPLRFLSLQHGIGILRLTPFTGAMKGCLTAQDTNCSCPLLDCFLFNDGLFASTAHITGARPL
jgi:hypothetical protein